MTRSTKHDKKDHKDCCKMKQKDKKEGCVVFSHGLHG